MKNNGTSTRRGLLKGIGAASLTPVLIGCGGGSNDASDQDFLQLQGYSNVMPPLDSVAVPLNKIVEENQLPGTEDWQLSNPIEVLPVSTYATLKDNRTYPCGDFDRNRNIVPLLEGFAYPHSVNIGEKIKFYVSTTSESYDLSIYRMGYYGGKGGRFMKSMSGLTVGGSSDPQTYPTIAQAPTTGTNRSGSYTLDTSDEGIYGNCSKWKPTLFDNNLNEFVIPSDWVSGFYVGKLTENGTGKQSYLIFVVTDDAAEVDVIFQSSLTTWHRYNCWGGASQYNMAPIGYNVNNPFYARPWFSVGNPLIPNAKVSLMRPFMPSLSPKGNKGVGAGEFFIACTGPGAPSVVYSEFTVQRDSNGNVVSATPVVPSVANGATDDVNATCSGWEYNVVRFLESNGYNVKYCTAMEIAKHQNYLAKAKIYLDAGHDEYVFEEQAANLLYARDVLGVHGIHLSGNHLFAFDGITMIDGQRVNSATLPYTVFRQNTTSMNDEYRLKLAGGAWTYIGPENVEAYLSAPCPSFLLKNTTFKTGDVVGSYKIIGYEADGFNVKWHMYQERYRYMTDMFRCPDNARYLHSWRSVPHAGALYATSEDSGAQTAHYNTIAICWDLDDFTLEHNPVFRRLYKADDNVKNMVKNSLDHLISSRFLGVIQKPVSSGSYSFGLADYDNSKKLVLNEANGSSPELSVSSSDPLAHTWVFDWIDTSTRRNTGKVWGKFLAAGDSDTWFRISSAKNPSLSLHALGACSSVVALPDQGTLRNCWRLIENHALSSGPERYVLIQNVATGNILYANSALLQQSDVSNSKKVIINAVLDGGGVVDPIVVRRTIVLNGHNTFMLGAVADFSYLKGVEVQLKWDPLQNSLVLSVIAARYQMLLEYPGFNQDLFDTPQLDKILRSGRVANVARSKSQPGYGLRNVYFEFENGKTLYPLAGEGVNSEGYIVSNAVVCSFGSTSVHRPQMISHLRLMGKHNRLDVDHTTLDCGAYWRLV